MCAAVFSLGYACHTAYCTVAVIHFRFLCVIVHPNPTLSEFHFSSQQPCMSTQAVSGHLLRRRGAYAGAQGDGAGHRGGLRPTRFGKS
jgi:hypothetical protein